MKKLYILCSFLLLVSVTNLSAQKAGRLGTLPSMAKVSGPVVSDLNSPNPDSLMAATIFGSCVEVLNFHAQAGSYQSFGLFHDSSATLGFSDGLVLTTGVAVAANGPNTAPNVGYEWNGMSDPYLNQLVSPYGYITQDAAVIEFDFIPIADTIYASDFVFGSEEYPEYVWSNYNDVFAFWISGPGINGMQNLALVPGTNKPITINTINQDSASAYYWRNDTGITAGLFQYDGFTTTIPLSYAVTPLDTYHFRIAIADASDAIYDSGVFIKKASFCGSTAFIWSEFMMQPNGGNTVAFTNTSGHADTYVWDFGDGSPLSTEEHPVHTFPDNGTYNVQLIADNICHADTFAQNLDLTTVGLKVAPERMKADLIPNGEGQYSLNTLLTSFSSIKVEVLNNQGQIIQAESGKGERKYHFSFNLSSNPEGVYFLRIQTDNDSKVIRFLR